MIQSLNSATHANHEADQCARVLLVSVPAPRDVAEGLSLRSTATAAGAAAEMRAHRFDLLVVSTELPDLPVWTLLRRVRAARPSQKWALASDVIVDREEIEARSLGALAILPGRPTAAQLAALAASLRKLCGNAWARDGPFRSPNSPRLCPT